MPKLIEGLQDRIIDTTRDILFHEGVSAVTVRSVASTLSIAPGTIYNYFPSKDVLLAQVFLSDWLEMTREAKAKAAKADSPIEVCREVFQMIQEYTARFSPIWKDSHLTLNQEMGKRHQMLKGQIADILTASTFFREEWTAGLNLFLSELLLSYGSGEPMDFEHIRPFLERLVK